MDRTLAYGQKFFVDKCIYPYGKADYSFKHEEWHMCSWSKHE